MPAIYLIVISILLFYLGYRWYADKLVRLWDVKSNNRVPSREKYDGIDYVPAKHWIVLFGHHFSSIAGAAPIVGPIIAVSIWGWAPCIIWIVLGTIFIGGVHDFGSLITSIKEEGSTVANISKKVLSNKAKLVFSIFLLLTLILIISVFVHLCAKTLVQKPQIVLPSWGLIFVALLVGFLLYRVKINSVFVTLLGILILIGLIILGHFFPISIAYKPIVLWTFILLIYSLLASITPVNILLQPRDYISAYLLFAGMFFGFLGLLITRPVLKLSAYTGFSSDIGPLWPILFVTVACGAISGFHSLVASGTTSKQISNEVDSKKIGYGAMVLEGFLGLLSLLLVAVTFSNRDILIFKLKELTPIGVFGESFGSVTKIFLGGYGASFAIIVLNAFIFTSLDTATRIARYITHELFGIKSIFLSSFIVVLFSGILAFSGQWIKIWPLFGAANQLLAALTLIILTSWLLSRQKPTFYTFYPALFMIITAVGALIYQFIIFLRNSNYLLMVISLALMMLTIFILQEAKRVYITLRGK